MLDLNDPGRRRIDAALLADGAHAHYQGVVLPDHAPPGLSAAELAALYAYERRFGIRQLDASATAKPTTGLAEPTPAVGYSGAFDGGTAQLTPEALAGDFAYARGPVPFSDDDPAVEDSYVQMATPLPGFRPLLTATSPDGTRSGALAGILSDAGREELVLTFSFDADARQLQVLAPGLVSWLTRGVHLGFDRSYLAVHIDDVLLPNVRWVPGVHCTPGADCPPSVTPPPDIRMTADDVAYAVEWQRRTGFRLDLAFNGAGSVAADAGAGTDPLTAALVAAKGEFGWINHTWSHRYLGCVRDHDLTPWSCATLPILGWTRYISSGIIESEITRNVEFARRNGLPIDPTELVTGEHGGLRAPPQLPDDNPHLAGALADAGIRTIAADGSIEPGLRPVGDAVAVPRHPIDLDFDTATVTETIDQYNWVHTSRADGGNGECEADGGCQKPAAPGSGYTDHIVPVEARKVLDHMLTNDPRPHYVHQPQLTEDRTIYPLLDRAIGDYRSWFGDVRPLITPTMTQSRARARPSAAVGRGGRRRTRAGPARGRRGHGRGGRRPPRRAAHHRPGRSGAGRRGVRHAVRDGPVGLGAGDGRTTALDHGTGADVKVALVTEGTYPLHHGGVAAWCDQLVRGLPELRFEVVALSGSGREPFALTPPSNVTAVRRVGLWARVPPGRPFTGRTEERFVGAYAQMFEAVLRGGPQAADWFETSLRTLRDLSRRGSLTGAMRSQLAVDVLLDVWSRTSVPGTAADVTMSLDDALAVTDLVEHFLRPLQLTPPKAKLVHATANGPSMLVGLTAKWSAGTPVLLSEHGVYLRERLLAVRRDGYPRTVRTVLVRFFHRLCELGYRSADAVLPVSDFNGRWAVRGGAPAHRVRTLHNGVDPRDLPLLEDEPRVPTLVFAGRIDPLKDIATLVRAFALVREHVPDARLKLFGGVPTGNEAYATEMRQLVADLNLEGCATFEGPVSPVSQAFEAGHVVVQSSLSEGLPLTVIEAAMAGRPTVVTDVGGMPEAAGRGGMVVPPGDPAAFAAACVTLLTAHETRRALAAAGREDAMARFTISRFLADVRDVYREHAPAKKPSTWRARRAAIEVQA